MSTQGSPKPGIEKDDEAIVIARTAREKAEGALRRLARIDTLLSDHDKLEKYPTELLVGDERVRRRWFPWLTIAISINVLLWLSMIYAIYEAGYYTTHHDRYLWTAWLIFAIPLVFVFVVIMTPRPHSWARRRSDFFAHKPRR